MLLVSCSKTQPENWFISLSFLYQPLIGDDAARLYQSLYGISLTSGAMAEEDLLLFLQWDQARYDTACSLLESFSLFSRKQILSHNLITLEPPLPAASFFQNPALRQSLEEKVGEQAAARFAAQYEEETTDSPPDPSPTALPAKDGAPFDWDLFFENMQYALPSRCRTETNMRKIETLAHQYELDELAMRRFVIRHFRRRSAQIDFDGLQNELQLLYPDAEASLQASSDQQESLDYSVDPVQFLKARQPANAVVTPQEKALLAELVKNHQFSNELINTIVEFSMERCNGNLIINYVRTVANNLARCGIFTRQDALEHFKAQITPRQKKVDEPQLNLPDWYEITPEQEAGEAEVQAVLAFQKEILSQFRNH